MRVVFGNYTFDESNEKHYKSVAVDGHYRGKVVFKCRIIGKDFVSREFYYVNEQNHVTELDVNNLHEAEEEIRRLYERTK